MWLVHWVSLTPSPCLQVLSLSSGHCQVAWVRVFDSVGLDWVVKGFILSCTGPSCVLKAWGPEFHLLQGSISGASLRRAVIGLLGPIFTSWQGGDLGELGPQGTVDGGPGRQCKVRRGLLHLPHPLGLHGKEGARAEFESWFD